MSREKLIDPSKDERRLNEISEMAKDVASTHIGTVKPDLTLTELGEVYKGEFILRIAKHLYNAGYRKQSEGEWMQDFDGDYYCPFCAHYPKEIKHYCPNCGAHMLDHPTEKGDE